jgi:hypothetical protein
VAQDADRESVIRFAREWSASVQNGPEAFASFFATDGALLPPDRPPIIGRVRIADWMRAQGIFRTACNPNA